MKSLYELIKSRIDELRLEYSDTAIDAFMIEASIHMDRDDDFNRGWYGIRGPRNINGVQLRDLNFCFKNTKPGDDGPNWELLDKDWYELWKSTSEDEWNYVNLER